MRYAFTLIELIFVITIIGILGMIVLPKLSTDDLGFARDQIIRHIRYTQHLALMDDKYLSEANLSSYFAGDNEQGFKDSTVWYKKMWRIQFHQNAVNGLDVDSYSIYSDQPTGTGNYATPVDPTNFEFNNNPDFPNDIIARDPQTGLLLAGRPTAGIVDSDRLLDLAVFNKYGVTINMGPCTMVLNNPAINPTPANHILFDHLGRPYCMPSNFVGLNPYDLLATTPIVVTLTDRSNKQLTITIEPETGYVH